MEAKRLIPYSVHLPEPVYKKLKAAAGERKASALVRDAITMIVEGGDIYNNGYNRGLQDAIKVIDSERLITGMCINGLDIPYALKSKITKLVVKEKTNGKKKARGD